MIKTPLSEFIANLAARQPAPAGGAAAAYTAAMGVALLQMALRFCRGKPANQGRDEQLAAADVAMAGFIEKFLPMLERDCKSFEQVISAYALPKDEGTVGVRSKALETALRGAITVPEELLCLSRDALSLAVEMLDCLAKNVASDFAAGATLLLAAAEAASMSIISNISFLTDRQVAEITRHRVADLLDEVVASKARIESAVGVLLA